MGIDCTWVEGNLLGDENVLKLDCGHDYTTI